MFFFKMLQRELWFSILGFEPNDVEMYTYVFSKLLRTNLEANMINFQKKHDFERMELLGDSLLQTIVTEKLFHDYSTGSPGQLTRLRSRMVRNDTLHLITKKLQFF
jgi:ribonuclease-3